MEKIKVLIVDDSAFMRKLIQDFLSEHPSITVVGTARNGEDALRKINKLSPDVITLDIEMPIMNGLQALEKIMKEHPVPVVMLSSTTQEGADNTIQAFALGAVDFVAKPSGAISMDLYKVKEELQEKVLSARKANVNQLAKKPSYVKSSTILTENYSKIERKEPIVPTYMPMDKKLICIGTSTGGPRALQNVITKLPKDLDAPVFVVQHMPPGFTKSLAARLDSLSNVSVSEAIDGELARKGHVYIAPGGYHMKISGAGDALKIHLDGGSAPRNGHRPSVDVMFESISKIANYEKIAVIMTGMGSDGADGLIELKKTGSVRAIAESKDTSIVYGMPKAAVATNLVDDIENVEKIAETIMKYV